MKTLKFNFCHPIKGNACLTLHSNFPSKCQSIAIDSKSSNLVEIPIDGCKAGKWSVVLNWEYDGSSFSYSKEFEVKNFIG